jgi:dolichol kinase
MELSFLETALGTVILVILLHLLLAVKPQILSNDRLQLRRKLQHITTGLLFFALESLFDKLQAMALLWFGAALVFGFHRLRIAVPAINERFVKICQAYLRPHERNNLPGAFYFFVGVAISVTLFPRRIALLALIYLSIGDPIASYFGIVFGGNSRKFSNGKSVVGMMAMMILCFVMTIAFFIVRVGIYDPLEMIIWALVGSISAAFAESLPVLQVLGLDDNLRVPVISGSALWVLTTIIR